MRIAQVSPTQLSVPPRTHGGTERIVYYIVEELVKQGCQVDLYASSDSITSARLHECGYEGPEEINQFRKVEKNSRHYDFIHFHGNSIHMMPLDELSVPFLATRHNLFDSSDGVSGGCPYISISKDQQSLYPNVAWIDNVYHGLPVDLYKPKSTPGRYFAFAGRIIHEKGLDRAIKIANATGIPLKIGGSIHCRDYFRNTIKPLIQGNHLVQFIGEVDDAAKQELFSNALALLFPIYWSEPFGLVMIEANACGTPVIAWRNGSTPEVIRQGVNGFLVNSIEEAIKAVSFVKQMDRQLVRKDFEARFTSTRMVKDYLRIYERLINGCQH